MRVTSTIGVVAVPATSTRTNVRRSPRHRAVSDNPPSTSNEVAERPLPDKATPDVRSLIKLAIAQVNELQRVESIDRDDAALLMFVIPWLLYGGPPEDELFTMSGLKPHQACLRVTATLGRVPDSQIGRHILAHLRWLLTEHAEVLTVTGPWRSIAVDHPPAPPPPPIPLSLFGSRR